MSETPEKKGESDKIQEDSNFSPQPEAPLIDETEEIISLLNLDQNTPESKLSHKSSLSMFSGDSSPRDSKMPLNESNFTDEDDEDQLLREASSNRIFEIIQTIQAREYTEDEWDNDDDNGYIVISLTEDEFFEYENKNLSKLVAEKAARLSLASAASSSTLSPDKGEDLASPPAKGSADVSAEIESSSPEKSPQPVEEGEKATNSLPVPPADAAYVPTHRDPFQLVPDDINNFNNGRRQSVGERRRSEIIGQHRFDGVDGMHCYFNLKVIFEPYKTGFEESKEFKHPKGTIIAGRYEVYDVLGSAAFSTALQCIDLAADTERNESEWVCLKVIKNNKDFFDQSLDEIKLLQYINSRGDPDSHYVLRLIDYFYHKEHLFIVSELLKENLYEFGRYIRENNLEIYYTLPRLKRIAKQVLLALDFVHQLKLIHCDVKPENIVIKSFSRCEVKLIDFGSSCFTSDHLTTYIQSRSYRAPEVILGHSYDGRIDIWSVGAVLAELYTNYVLFQNDSVATMLSRIIGILGPFPTHFLKGCREANKYFTSNNLVFEREEQDSNTFHLVFPKYTTLASRLHMAHAHRKLSRDEELFVDFVRQLLDLDCDARPTAAQALQHPWLTDADTVYFSEYIIGQPRKEEPEEAEEGEREGLGGVVYERDEDYEEDEDELGDEDQEEESEWEDDDEDEDEDEDGEGEGDEGGREREIGEIVSRMQSIYQAEEGEEDDDRDEEVAGGEEEVKEAQVVEGKVNEEEEGEGGEEEGEGEGEEGRGVTSE